MSNRKSSPLIQHGQAELDALAALMDEANTSFSNGNTEIELPETPEMHSFLSAVLNDDGEDEFEPYSRGGNLYIPAETLAEYWAKQARRSAGNSATPTPSAKQPGNELAEAVATVVYAQAMANCKRNSNGIRWAFIDQEIEQSVIAAALIILQARYGKEWTIFMHSNDRGDWSYYFSRKTK